MKELAIGKENFEKDVKNAVAPVLLDFYADWCGPCKMMAPVVARIAENYGDKLVVGKVNVDEERELAEAFGIASIPTLVLLKGGEPVDAKVGFSSNSEVCEWLVANGVTL